MVLGNVDIGSLVSMIRKSLLLTAISPSCICNMTRSADKPSLNTDQLRVFGYMLYALLMVLTETGECFPTQH